MATQVDESEADEVGYVYSEGFDCAMKDRNKLRSHSTWLPEKFVDDFSLSRLDND